VKDLVIVGAGGFGREVVQVVAAINVVAPTWNLRGVVDDGPDKVASVHLGRLDVPLLGPMSRLRELAYRADVVIAIGDPTVRRRVATEHDWTAWATLVHPDATVGPDVELGPGTVVAAGARLSTHIVVGRHVHVDQNATVGHDSTLGDHCRLNPQACVSGSVVVGERALVGAGATVLQGLSVGADAVVGAGAVVTRDVPEATTVKGVPAR